MTRLHDLWLPKHNPLIARLHEFRNDIVGVAAFLDECEERGIDIPLLKVVPELWAYGRGLTQYLLFLHAVQSDRVRLTLAPNKPNYIIDVKAKMYQHEPVLNVMLSHEVEEVRYLEVERDIDYLRNPDPRIELIRTREVMRRIPAEHYRMEIGFDLRQLEPIVDLISLTIFHIEKLIRDGKDRFGASQIVNRETHRGEPREYQGW